MSRKILAIANCRVSSDDQLLNNSLVRQRLSVESAANRLGAEIAKTWSGSVSSKAGTNVKRKDLLAMLDFCKQHKNIKYAIFDEYDRFMRSVNEGPYFEVLFQEQGVKVWYASESDAFNGDDAMAKFMRTMSAYKAEGSNEERQRKSIAGQTVALKEGRYPFSPKPGYKRGYERGVQEIHPVRGPALKFVLVRLTSKLITPSQAVVELNNSAFIQGRARYKMDKFRKIATDPFYAGIVEIDAQVKVRNENGLHEPLITRQQHEELLKIFDAKRKTQVGPRKNGNPKYPLSNLVTCSLCLDNPVCRYVGFDHSNGKKNGPTYEKYRCRACGKYMTREDLHTQVQRQFKQHPVSKEGINDFIEALSIVWKRNEGQAEQEGYRIKHKIENLKQTIEQQVEAVTDPSNLSVKDEIIRSIAKKKAEIKELVKTLDELKDEANSDKERFLRFALDLAANMGAHFLEISPENRIRCKDIVFPAGFYVDENKRVYTPEISPLIRLASNKKDLPKLEKSLLVRVRGL